MATKRVLHCDACGPAEIGGTLFQTLKSLADDPKFRSCRKCRAKADVRLSFEFGLGAGDSEMTVEGVFYPHPPEHWAQADGSTVAFYPFLVILKRSNRAQAVWLPYWHVVTIPGRPRPKEKYGQWAPCMDSKHLENMLAQARAAGFSI